MRRIGAKAHVRPIIEGGDGQIDYGLCSVENSVGNPASFRPKGRFAARSGEIYSNRFLDSPLGLARNDKSFGFQQSIWIIDD
jgi:hypothetical protein